MNPYWEPFQLAPLMAFLCHFQKMKSTMHHALETAASPAGQFCRFWAFCAAFDFWHAVLLAVVYQFF